MSTITNTKKPRSEAQIAQSRLNGAKSLGPVTADGKCKISHNRMVHGFRSNSIPLGNEDRTAYDDHLNAYLARYTPIDKVEEDLVGLLASNMWQLMRNNAIEVALFDIEISGIDVELHGIFENMDEYGRLALAFKKSSGDNALELLRRYKSTAERAYHRALQALEQIRQDRSREDRSREDRPENISTVQTQAAESDHKPSEQPPDRGTPSPCSEPPPSGGGSCASDSDSSPSDSDSRKADLAGSHVDHPHPTPPPRTPPASTTLDEMGLSSSRIGGPDGAPVSR